MKNYTELESPIGNLYLVSEDDQLIAIVFEDSWKTYKKEHKSIVENLNPVLKLTKKQLIEYFNGKRRQFDIPIRFTGTPFQIKAWKQLIKIPFGKTASYKDQAKAIGSEKAVRAIGSANSVNQIPIIVPCHRVIASNGKLSGYAGGVHIKEYLLEIERK
jgi:methylated-DNA-[protein]-cysteine S-methyltransferase